VSVGVSVGVGVGVGVGGVGVSNFCLLLLRQVIHSSVPLIAVYFLTLFVESQKIASDLLLHNKRFRSVVI